MQKNSQKQINRSKFYWGDTVKLSPLGLKYAKNYNGTDWSLRIGIVQKHTGITIPVKWEDSKAKSSTYYHPTFLELVK